MPSRKMIEMFKEYDEPPIKGEKYREIWEMVYEDGVKKPKVVGRIDVQEEIESYRESVDINCILSRFAAGDITALNRAQTFYADVSEMPIKLQDMLAINQQGLNIFNALSAEVKELFGNDYMKFIQEPEILNDYMAKNYPQDVNNNVEKKDNANETSDK